MIQGQKMVSYQDILYPLDFSYGIREIYDLAPWAFDLFIFAAVLSALFKPVFKKLPIFAGHNSLGTDNKASESDRLAYILSFVFSGSTVYWMQVQGTNLAAAAPYLILILFVILGIFIYNLIAATTWGAKHKFFSGVIAFFITMGLCQALFGVGDIFSDVFPIFNALFVFFARILLWIILFTIIFLLIGRFWEGKNDGGTPSGGGPSGPSGPSGPGFWSDVKDKFGKAKKWVNDYRAKRKQEKIDFDMKDYEKKIGEAELKIDAAYNDAKNINNLLEIQQNLLNQLYKFFPNLAKNLETVTEYFKKHNIRGGKPSSDIINWNNQLGELSKVLSSTNEKVKNEFNKLIPIQSILKKHISSFDNSLIALRAAPNILMHRTEGDEKFFKEHDQKYLSKVAELFKKIDELRSKNHNLDLSLAQINSEINSLNKLLPENVGTDLFNKTHTLLIGDLNYVLEGLNNVITHQGTPELFKEIDNLIVFLNKNTFNRLEELSKKLNDAKSRVALFTKALQEINVFLNRFDTDIKEINNFKTEIEKVSDNLFEISKKIEKERETAQAEKSLKAKKEQTVKQNPSEEETSRAQASQKDYYLSNLKELKTTFEKMQGIVGGAQGILKERNRSKYGDINTRITSMLTGLNSFNKALKIKFQGETTEVSRKKEVLQNKLNEIYQLGEQILNGVATIQKAKSEEDKKEYEDIALIYIQDLNKLISKQLQRPIDDLIAELNSAPKKSKKK